MAINESIYGNASTWIDVPYRSGYEDYPSTKLCNFNNGTDWRTSSTLNAGRIAGKIRINEEIDHGIAAGAFGSGAPYSDIGFYCYENQESTSSGKALPLYIHTANSTPYFYSLGTTQSGYSAGQFPYMTVPSYSDARNAWGYIDNNFPEQSPEMNWSPITSFSYQNTIALVLCKIRDSKFTTTSKVVTLDSLKHYTGQYLLSVSASLFSYGAIAGSTMRRDPNYTQTWNISPLITYTPYQEYTSGGEVRNTYLNYERFLGFTSAANIYEYDEEADTEVNIDTVSRITLQVSGARNARQLLTESNNGGRNRRIIPVLQDSWYRTEWQNNYLYTNKELSESNIESIISDIRTQAAHLGLFFTGDHATAREGALDDPLMYLGLLDENGISTGQYTHGEENRNSDQFSWTDSIKDNNYDPYKPVDPNDYDEETILNTNAVYLNTGLNKFTRTYKIDSLRLGEFANYLYETVGYHAGMDDKYLIKNFLTTNPIECIVSVQAYNIDLDKYFPGGLTTKIQIGNTTSEVSATAIAQPIGLINAGYCTYFPEYEDFRDYEPYSSAELFIPYHGSVSISPSEFIGHTIQVYILLDISTGSSLALIYRDGLCVDQIPGNMSAQVTVTGIQQADYANATYRAAANLKQARNAQGAQTFQSVMNVAGGVANVATGNVVGGLMQTIGSIGNGVYGAEAAKINVESAQYELDHVKVPYKVVGTASPATSMANEQACRLILKRPKMMHGYNPVEYGHNVGFATLQNAELSSFTGYTVCTTVDTSGLPATEAEKEAIIAALQSGVYL